MEIDRALAQMLASGNSAGLTLMQAQSAEVASLLSRIATARPDELPALQGEVVAVAAAAADSVEQARNGGADAANASANLSDARAASRATASAVMARMGDFDLDFASAEDERAYREREAQRQADFAAQQAKHTPGGDLNAACDAAGQMVDAHAHGAGGPEFDRRWHALVETTERLRAAAKVNGVSTEEFDDHLRADLRRIMKAKGLNDAQIDARFAANPDPLQAAKAYVQAGEVNALSQVIDIGRTPTDAARANDQPDIKNMNEAMAQFRAAGVIAAEPTDTHFVHGVTSRDQPQGKAVRPSPG